MALVRNFEIPGTGVTVNDAYHVIVNVTTEKRLQDLKNPADLSHPSGLTNGGNDDRELIDWKAGYIGRITLEVYASKTARDEGKTPIGGIGLSPTEAVHPELSTVHTPGSEFKIKFIRSYL